jgi:hypothetical protein
MHTVKALMIALVLSFLSRLNAQTYSNKPSFLWGLTAGMTSSNLVNNNSDFKAGILFNGGGHFALMLNDRWNLALEALYGGRAFRNETPVIRYSFYYADFPLFIQLKASESIRFNAGFQYSKFINSKFSRIDGSSKNGMHSYTYENIRDQDYSVLAGAEIDLNKNLSVGARYTLSASAFTGNKIPNFGVFAISFRYVAYRSYRQLFHTKEEK